MNLTNILSQYLYEAQYQELKADEEYQTASAARGKAEEELTATLSPQQITLFHTYMERENYLIALELQHFLSNCSLLLLPQKK